MKTGLWVLLLAVFYAFLSDAVNAQKKTDVLPKRAEIWAPVRAVTHGPKYHWFACYDKLEFDTIYKFVLDFNFKPETKNQKLYH